MHFGTKVKAFANSEEARVGFIVNAEADEEGKFGVQVGDGVYALSQVNEANPDGNNGGTFTTNLT